ncbi:extracellular solute-binding protein [Paenibacillus sp. J2TS4]|uniref:extracellular solute-binding protein n=1 Tax=Paenibacillus sp. J2TS4 TaxID=2807194 RepID=UPI001B018AA8|nr:extracellular solute-binding protein [Paenibacillus sp. J2TS4]GIP33398.1 hypothetical protein J2TS4_26080 [Paenibacillus sp. J2TS4]
MEKRNLREKSRMRLNQFIQTLREEIRSGQRKAGDYLPSEKAFAEQYSLSNQTVRKGLDVLVSEKLIAKIPRVGTKVLGPSDDTGVTVKLGFHPSVTREADLEQLLALFHKKFPAIRVQMVPVSSKNYEYLHHYLTGGIIDAAMMNYTNFQELQEKSHIDLLAPLKREEDIYSFLSDAFTVNGSLLAQPFIFSPLILCYNREHFRDTGIPEPDSSWQWPDLLNYAARLAVPGERLGFHGDLLSYHRWPLFLLQSGLSFERSKDGRIRLAGTKMMEAIRNCGTMLRDIPHLFTGVTTGESERMLAKGQASIILTSYFYLNYLSEEPLSFDVAPVPHLGTPMTLLLNTGLAVSGRSPVKEAAVQLVEFLTSSEAQLVIRRQTYSLPARKSAAEWIGEESKSAPSRFSLFRETIPGFRYFTDLSLTATELTALGEELKLFWAGLANEEAFCRQVEQVGQRLPPPEL